MRIVSVILARGCRAKNPEFFWLQRNRCASGTTTYTSCAVSQERSIPALPTISNAASASTRKASPAVHGPLQGEPAGVVRGVQ